MKKFQKILSAGLALTQLCSANCVLGIQDNHTRLQNSVNSVNVTPNNDREMHQPAKKAPGIAKKISKGVGFTLLALLAVDTGLQIGCSASSTFAKEWAKYIDKNLYEILDPDVNLSKLSELIDRKDFKNAEELCNKLQPRALDGGFTHAAKLASLGFADYICVSKNGGAWTCFFLPIGWSLSTSMGIYNYLQHLIDKCSSNLGQDNTNSGDLMRLIQLLEKVQELVYENGVPYTAWTKLKETAGNALDAVGDAWNAVKKPLSKQPEQDFADTPIIPA